MGRCIRAPVESEGAERPPVGRYGSEAGGRAVLATDRRIPTTARATGRPTKIDARRDVAGFSHKGHKKTIAP